MILTKNKPISILDYLIVGLVILNTSSVYSITVDRDYHLHYLLAFFLLIRLCFFRSVNSNVLRNYIVFSFVWTAYIVMYALIAGGDAKALFSRFYVEFLLLVLYFALYKAKHDLKELLCYYVNIILVLAAISLFFWLLGSVVGILKPSGSVLIDWGKDRVIGSYYGLYFQWQNDVRVLGKTIYRNIGLFPEGPIHSLHLSIAFALEYLGISSTGKTRKIKILILAVSIVSTLATTGVIFVLLSYILEKLIQMTSSQKKNRKNILSMLLFPLMAIIAIIVGYRLFAAKLGSLSGASRVDDYISGFKAWLDNPAFGAGYGDISVRVSYSSAYRLSRSNYGYTNSIMKVLDEGGIYWFSSYVAAIIAIFKNFPQKNIKVFVLLFVYLFLTTTFEHTTLVVAILAIGYSSLVLQRRHIRNTEIVKSDR